jgi:hypothetical protein
MFGNREKDVKIRSQIVTFWTAYSITKYGLGHLEYLLHDIYFTPTSENPL